MAHLVLVQVNVPHPNTWIGYQVATRLDADKLRGLSARRVVVVSDRSVGMVESQYLDEILWSVLRGRLEQLQVFDAETARTCL